MFNKKECSIVQDLLPLYIDEVVKEETKEFVDEHLQECEDCKQELENCRQPLSVDVEPQQEVEAKKIKKGIAYFKRKQSVKACTLVLLAVVFIYAGTNLGRNIKMNRLTCQEWCYEGQKAIFFDEYNRLIMTEEFDKISDIDLSEGSGWVSWAGYGSYSVDWRLLDSDTIRVIKENQSMDMTFSFKGSKLVLNICGKNYILDKMK